MAQKKQDAPLRALVERLTAELRSLIESEVKAAVTAAIGRIPSTVRAAGVKVDNRRSGRLCPVPGCGQPGRGPRNRWFCGEHAKKLSVAEQRGIIERNRRLSAEGKLPTPVPAQKIVRVPARAQRPRRTLDMSCRVDGCPNRSRGPRAGFICDQHRLELTPDEQRLARERWNARLKGRVLPEAPVAAGIRPAPMPVPPIVRKAEPAEA